MVPAENATNLIDSNEIKREVGTTRSLINRICKCQATFFSYVMRGKKWAMEITSISHKK